MLFRTPPKGAQSIGWPVAVFLGAAACFAVLYVSDSLVAARHGGVVRMDEAVAVFVSGYRTPALVGIFSIVTAFGYWAVVLVMAAAVSILLWLGQRTWYIAGLWVALAGNQVSVNLLKAVFARIRPELAYYSESSYSFPSGHSAVSAAFFGFLTYLVIRERFATAGPAITGGVVAILLVGMSRIILGEHYPSDVLGGYGVGAVWAWSGMWLTECRRPTEGSAAALFNGRRISQVAVVVAAAVVVALLAAHYQHNLVIMPVPSAVP